MEQLVATVRGVKVSYSITNREASETIIFLHGFTGSSKTWVPIIEQLPDSVRCITVDLMGHGKTDSPSDANRYIMYEQVMDLHELFLFLNVTNFSLVGYSMGGRIALAYALAFPKHVKRLVLESASPGLQSEADRLARITADEKLAKKMESEGLSSFIDFWQDIPLFHSQKKLGEIKLHSIREERMQQAVSGLANSLKGMGTGRQPSYWSRLNELKITVIIITGELDEKFTIIAKQITELIRYSQHLEVSGAGHAIHVENPVQFATIILEQVLERF
ncbi:2-succinyl-6-hydroxy-2,4-cyclohexadiene-1-carboxylate synthase [Paenisporosarcina sp. HGH0030]|uniref:2-succinyl-6-hydroxy-2, 4-cyclohexadiene-1-carboxylate synthase n=1 Tax=Paenisporosarcina sp. HGH0030 TaxID=1078085 RepID=UPI00034E9923|nr:2-succinyl-6-hydroxy-2,4-cyclohexadiene-1-carboxylate synthase [Paenisporosarcina sp. HGH0030]EPD54038.1 2-succinyl-6-hydroxy-2,4-cyclohexadiene-1-carboxylate synthase [Paenisporosarcina sp. HGH0030]